MKQTLIAFITFIFCVLHSNAQISLQGIVNVQNSKTATGLSPLAKTLTGLGILHVDTREYSKTSEEYEEALTIFKKLAEENQKDVEIGIEGQNLLTVFHLFYKRIKIMRRLFDNSLQSLASGFRTFYVAKITFFQSCEKSFSFNLFQ